MNMNIVTSKLIDELTEPVYYSKILQIADILNNIDLNPKVEEQAKTLGIDVESFAVKLTVEKLNGDRRYISDHNDIMQRTETTSLDGIADSFTHADEYIPGESNINEFVNLYTNIKKHDIRSYNEKIGVILDIMKQVEEGKNLESIFVQKQPASKWLFDVLRGKDGAQYEEAIKIIRDKSKGITYGGTKTQRIKAGISDEDLKNMSCEALSKKYPTLVDYGSGSDRKIISRLKARLAKC